MSTPAGTAPETDWTVTRTAEALARGQGKTLTQLGEEVGIAKATMSRRVNLGGWRLTEVTRMAWALGYTANDLITALNGALKLDTQTEGPRPDVPNMAPVRREGIEPPTRWLSVSPSRTIFGSGKKGDIFLVPFPSAA